MTHYLGIITAYGAVAVLAWLAALLYPRLIPRAGLMKVERRWPDAGLLALAVALCGALAFLNQQGWLLTQGTWPPALVNQLIIYAPIVLYLGYKRSRDAALVPSKQVVRSLVIGLLLGGLALSAYFSTTNGWDVLPEFASNALSANSLPIIVKTLLQSAMIAAILALVASAWSTKAALALSALVIAATHVPALLESGASGQSIGGLLVHLAVGLGLFSAILATRNIVWAWPVYALLALAQLLAGA